MAQPLAADRPSMLLSESSSSSDIRRFRPLVGWNVFAAKGMVLVSAASGSWCRPQWQPRLVPTWLQQDHR